MDPYVIFIIVSVSFYCCFYMYCIRNNSYSMYIIRESNNLTTDTDTSTTQSCSDNSTINTV